MTYSIVARDPHTGVLGVAVQTAMFAAGASVPWARAGVGAVSAQAMAEPAYAPRCLDAIQAGVCPGCAGPGAGEEQVHRGRGRCRPAWLACFAWPSAGL